MNFEKKAEDILKALGMIYYTDQMFFLANELKWAFNEGKAEGRKDITPKDT